MKPGEDWRAAGFGIYIHWPFCQAKCPYCDFNSHVWGHVDQDAWCRALLSELDWVAAQSPGRQVDTVFFGGGTPSLMPPDTVGQLLSAIASHWHMVEDAEITLEANPTSVEASRFADYRAAGVTRVSLGVQALSDADLKALGRLHSAAEAIQAIDIANKYFDQTSFDLIYARQNQTMENWRDELTRALEMSAGHLSLYQLTIEAETRFGALFEKGKLRGLPSDDLSADLYEMTQSMCAEAGLPAYEISNHAAPDAACRHNKIYWQGGDYAGIGPGAHGRLTLDQTRFATETVRDPTAWMALVAKDGHGHQPFSPLTGQDHATEYLLMSLRMVTGTSLTRLEKLAPGLLDHAAIDRNRSAGFLILEGDMLSATAAGRMVLNRLLAEILA